MGGVVVVNMLTLDGVIQGPLREGAGTATSTPPGIATHKSARG
jgi:catechol 2,3-dioxygenase